jgi:hypothetical protein
MAKSSRAKRRAKATMAIFFPRRRAIASAHVRSAAVRGSFTRTMRHAGTVRKLRRREHRSESALSRRRASETDRYACVRLASDNALTPAKTTYHPIPAG